MRTQTVTSGRTLINLGYRGENDALLIIFPIDDDQAAEAAEAAHPPPTPPGTT